MKGTVENAERLVRIVVGSVLFREWDEDGRLKDSARSIKSSMNIKNLHIIEQSRASLKIALAQADANRQYDGGIDSRALCPCPRGTVALLMKYV